MGNMDYPFIAITPRSTLVGFIAKIILISQKYFFLGYSKQSQIKQNALDLNRGLSSKFWWLKSANHVKFAEECVMYMHVLIKDVYKSVKHMFATHKPELKRHFIE